MCCGSRRSAWRAATTAPAAPSTRTAVREGPAGNAPTAPASAAAAGMQGSFPTVTLRYTQASAIRLRGPVTARLYEFSVSQPDQPVDVRDAAVLLGNGAFRRQEAGQPG